MKKVAVLYSAYTPTIDAIKFRLEDFAECFCYKESSEIQPDQFDLIVNVNYNGVVGFDTLNIHHSLLPAFEGEEPVKQAVIRGVKVTGLTIYYTKTKKIVTQYPIFIYNDAHYDELKQEILYLEQTIYPLVVEKILKNEPFEIRALMNSKNRCTGSCKECGGCNN